MVEFADDDAELEDDSVEVCVCDALGDEGGLFVGAGGLSEYGWSLVVPMVLVLAMVKFGHLCAGEWFPCRAS